MSALPNRLKYCNECCLTRSAWIKIVNHRTENTLRELLQEAEHLSNGLYVLINNLLIEGEIDQEDEYPETRFMDEKPLLSREAIINIYCQIHRALAGSRLKKFIYDDLSS